MGKEAALRDAESFLHGIVGGDTIDVAMRESLAREAKDSSGLNNLHCEHKLYQILEVNFRAQKRMRFLRQGEHYRVQRTRLYIQSVCNNPSLSRLSCGVRAQCSSQSKS